MQPPPIPASVAPGESKANAIPEPSHGAENPAPVARMHPVWRIELFGGLRAHRLEARWGTPTGNVLESFRTQKTAALFAFLAINRRAHKREILAEMFWPEKDLDAGRNSLRVSLTSLRTLLEPESTDKGVVLRTTRESVGLSENVITDLELFRARVREAQAAHEEKTHLATLEAALSLVNAPLLQGFYEDFVLSEVNAFEGEFLRVVQQVVARREAQGDLLAALDAARRAARIAPHHHNTMREVVRIGIKAGQNEGVRREFELWKRRLIEDGHTELPPQWNEFANRAIALQQGQLSLHSSANSNAASNGAPASLHAPPQPVSDGISSTTNSRAGQRALRSALPVSLTSFIGRFPEIEAALSYLRSPQTRLLTLLGTGGIGKTRVALEIARLVSQQAANRGAEATTNSSEFFGVAWIPLTHLPSPRLLGGAVLHALGRPQGSESVDELAGIIQELTLEHGGGRLLLVLDNFEHLGQSAVPWVHTLLTRTENIACLTTSRIPLRISGEQELLLGPLESDRRRTERVPENAATPISSDNKNHWPDAVRLFIERARLARPDFAVENATINDIARLCARLGGLPLAIEVAAARSTLFSPAQLLAEIERVTPRLPKNPSRVETRSTSLLDWPNLDLEAPSRQRNLRIAIDWSARQLPPPAARFWAQASVFSDSFTLEAAASVCEEPNTPALVLTLRDSSLLGLNTKSSTPRAVWMETLREFASQRLGVAERERLAARHAAHFLAWCEGLEAQIENGRARRVLEQLENERPNLRSAFDWFLQYDVEGALRMVAALWWHWEQMGLIGEGRVALEHALDAAVALPLSATPPTDSAEVVKWRQLWHRRAYVHEGAGKMANIAADLEAARTHLEASRQIYQLIGDEAGVASCLYSLGFAALQSGDLEAARILCEQSVAILRARDNQSALTDGLYNLAFVALMSGDFEAVRALSSEGLALHREAGNARGIALSLESLGMASLFSGELGAAHSYFEQARLSFEALGEGPSVARVLWGLGHIARMSNNHPLAHEHFERAFHLMRSAHNFWALPYVIEAFALLAVDEEDWLYAVRLLGGAAHWRETGQSPLPGAVLGQQIEEVVATAHQKLGEAHFRSEWTVGQSLSREELMNLVAMRQNGTR